MFDWLRVAAAKARALFSKHRLDEDFAEELQAHLTSLTEENLYKGMSTEEASRAARLRLGGLTQLREAHRELRGLPIVETLFRDVHYALRTLRKNPGFTLVAVLTLGLGIGANTAVFSMAQGFLLKPLTLPSLNRLVAIGELQAYDNNDSVRASPANYLDWVSQNQSFDRISAFDWETVNLSGVAEPLVAQGIHVSADFFGVLGVRPLLGRTFLPEEDQPGHEHEVVLTRGLWERQFGSDLNVVGKTVRINGSAYTVVGVMDRDCRFPQSVELWVPLALDAQGQHNRNDRYLQVMAHLKPGVSREQAQAEMKTVAGRLADQYPQTNRDWTAQVISLRDYAVFRGSGPFMFLLMGAVGFVLLIACANVANLLFARATGRQREIAVRAALGASRWRVLRQLLSESVVLGLLGAGAGVLLAQWAVYLILVNMPPDLERFVAGWDQIRLDGTVFVFALAVAVTAGGLAGLAPAFQSWRPDLNAVLKEGARNSSGGRSSHRLRNAFVIAQISLALTLIVGAGVMVRGFRGLLDANRRFHPESLLTMQLVLPDSPVFKDPHRRAAFYDQTLKELGALPGVRAATLVTGFPFSGLMNNGTFSVEGQPATDAGAQRFAIIKDISPNYFGAMGAPLLQGRAFSDLDGPDSAPVALVSERLAKLHWPNRSPLSLRIKVGAQDSSEPWLTIVGVVGDIKYDWAGREPELPAVRAVSSEPVIYRPYRQAPQNYVAFGLRTTVKPDSLVSAARSAVTRVSPDQPIFNVEGWDRVIRDNTLPIAYVAVMMAVAGALALLLASVGVYSVMAYSVAERTHEIGVRIVVGARPKEVMRLVVGRGCLLTVLGFAFGLPSAFGLAHLEANLLAGVDAKDFWTFSWVSALLGVVSLLACYIPARRAIRVDPIVALRCE
jgi:putative ABC transport system permease protein